MLIITQEAKRLRRALPASHLIEVADLVAAGALRIHEGLRFDLTGGPALVRVWSRQGMLEEIRRWDHGTKTHPVRAAAFSAYEDGAVSLKRCIPAPPIELMIDLLRELLRVRLPDAFAWVCSRINDQDHGHAASELGEADCSMRNRVSRASKQLRVALREYEPRPAKTPHQRAVELFREGASCAEVHRRLGMSEARAARIQDSVDPLAKRRRAAWASKIRNGRPEIKLADIVALRRDGLTQKAIADRLGCGQALVNRRMNKAGLNEGRIDSLRKAGIRPLAKCGVA
jgi:transposase